MFEMLAPSPLRTNKSNLRLRGETFFFLRFVRLLFTNVYTHIILYYIIVSPTVLVYVYIHTHTAIAFVQDDRFSRDRHRRLRGLIFRLASTFARGAVCASFRNNTRDE